MILSALMKKGGLREFATAISATAATDDRKKTRTVARVATVAVANPQGAEIDGPPETAILDDPVLSPEQWYPSFREFHHSVIRKTPDFDYLWLKENRPELYRQIKAGENQIDALGPARLSDVMAVMRQWRDLILRAEFEQRDSRKSS